jgi:hypothetical protein
MGAVRSAKSKSRTANFRRDMARPDSNEVCLRRFARRTAAINGLELGEATRFEPGADAEIDNLASAIIDEAARPDLIDLAREIAEAEIDLRRIAQARQALAKAPLPTTRVLAAPE